MDIEKNFVHLARLALDGKTTDVGALCRKVLRELGLRRPDLQTQLDELLQKANQPAVVRGATPAVPVDADSRMELLRREDPCPPCEPVWSEAFRHQINLIVLEREYTDQLTKEGLHPTKTMLFVGPPGVGKTLAAHWIAYNLRLPLLVLDLASVMSSFLGRTGNNLRAVLEYARRQNCVLLLDEFDAIAKRRDDTAEVGELKRLVTVILQAVDEWPSTGLLLAATNHPELLDPAIWRRFERVVPFQLPSQKEISSTLRQVLPDLNPEMTAALARTMKGLSQAEIHRLALNAKRDALVCKQTLMEALIYNLHEHVREAPTKERQRLAEQLTREGLSQRQISAITGVARDTLRKHGTDAKKSIQAKKPIRKVGGNGKGA